MQAVPDDWCRFTVRTAEGGLGRSVVSKSKGPVYRVARKAGWGTRGRRPDRAGRIRPTASAVSQNH